MKKNINIKIRNNKHYLINNYKIFINLKFFIIIDEQLLNK